METTQWSEILSNRLLVRVIVCPWEVFLKVEYDVGSIGILSQTD